jgi:ankyrin repeat protein
MQKVAAAITYAAVLGVGTAHADDRLIIAARNQDTAAVRMLLKQKAVDVNAAAPDGATPLLWTAQWDDLESARSLIAAGAKVDVANEYGVTPLAMAATNGSASMVQALLAAGANPNLALPSGQTPLMIAAMTGRLEPVRALLAKGASVHARDKYRDQTALMWATGEGHRAVVEALIAAGAEVSAASQIGFTPIMFAARNGDVPMMQLLLSHGAHINETMKDGTTVLHVAVVRGKVETAEFILNLGADPNSMGPGYSPLHWVSGTWETYMTKDYAQADGEWANLGGLPTSLKIRLATSLIAKGADVNARLKNAPPKFGYSFKRWLGEGGTLEGATPFLLAAIGGETDLMRVLAARGADPTAMTKNKTTALMIAAGIASSEDETNIPQARRLSAAQLCVELGVPIDAQSESGMTALHAAAFAGADTVASFLIAHGANMRLKTKGGQTPLSLAEGSRVGTMLFVHEGVARIIRTAGGSK